jgi:periplasmic divalent cation tolerance protein
MYIVVLITCPGVEDGERIADMLLRERLAACVNIIPGLKSKFWWTGKIHTADEALLAVKTKKGVLRELIKKVKAVHQYTNPEIIALPIIGGSKEFTKWIDDETK